MPCDAVATLTAKVSEKLTKEVLESEKAAQAVLQYLQQKGYVVTMSRRNGLLEFQMSNYWTIQIRNGQVYAQGLAAWEPNDLLRDMTQFVKQLGGVLLQQKVAQAIAKHYRPESQQYAPNGSLVLRVNL